jgi:hypothetical protein
MAQNAGRSGAIRRLVCRVRAKPGAKPQGDHLLTSIDSSHQVGGRLRPLGASDRHDLIGDLRGHDPDWRIHRGFYADIGKHLNPAGCWCVDRSGGRRRHRARLFFTFRFARLVTR